MRFMYSKMHLVNLDERYSFVNVHIKTTNEEKPANNPNRNKTRYYCKRI